MGIDYDRCEHQCFFHSIRHKSSGEEIYQGDIVEGVYIEPMDLSGPKMVVKVRDFGAFLSARMNLKEFDEFSVSLLDGYGKENASIKGDWVLLKHQGVGGGMEKLFLMSKDVWKMKELAKTTTIYHKRSVAEMLQGISQGLKPVLGLFGIVSDYHVYAGERPTETLRQIAKEHGAHVWTARGDFHMDRLAQILAQPPSMEFVWQGSGSEEHPILSYKRTTEQAQTQDESARSFTGWDETKGRVKTSPAMPFLQGLGRRAPSQTSVGNAYTLNNAPVAMEKAVDFYTPGCLAIKAGMTAKCRWNTGDPARPIDAGLPAHVVVTSVSHWYRAGGEFYSRVEGSKAAVAFK